MFKILVTVFASFLLLQLQSINGQQVSVQLDGQALPQVMEGATVEACFVLDPTPSAESTVSVNVVNNTIDIGAVNETFIFSAETTQQCINITLPVDDILESTQFSQDIFLITISDGNGTDRSMTAGSLFIQDATVLTTDFEATQYTFIEGAGNFMVCARLNGVISRTGTVVSVMASFTSGSATSPDDYANINIEFTFMAGVENQTQVVCEPISIINDNITESSENFSLSLMSPSPLASLMIIPTRGTTLVTIIDDEEGSNCGPPPSRPGVLDISLRGPYQTNAGGVVVANDGAVATFSCSQQGLILTGATETTCTNMSESGAAWMPSIAPTCENPPSPNPPSPNPPPSVGRLSQPAMIGIGVGVGVGGAFVVFVLILLCICCIVCCQKKRKHSKYVLNYNTAYGSDNRPPPRPSENDYGEAAASKNPPAAQGKPEGTEPQEV